MNWFIKILSWLFKMAHSTKVLLSEKPIYGIASGFSVPLIDGISAMESVAKSIGILFATGVAILTFSIKFMDWKAKRKALKKARKNEN